MSYFAAYLYVLGGLLMFGSTTSDDVPITPKALAVAVAWFIVLPIVIVGEIVRQARRRFGW